ncbi:hypothetical protein D3C86_1702060 [compost metagenome]
MGAGADDTGDNADAQQDRDHQMRAHDAEIEVADVQQRAFVRHVELAAFWEDHRDNGWQHQVERQH